MDESRVYIVLIKGKEAEELIGVFNDEATAMDIAARASGQLEYNAWYIDILSVPFNRVIQMPQTTSCAVTTKCPIHVLKIYANPLSSQCSNTCTPAPFPPTPYP